MLGTIKGVCGPYFENCCSREAHIYAQGDKKYKDVHYSIVCNSKQQPYPNIGVMDKWNIYIHLQCNFMQHVDISQHGEIAKAMSSK